MEMRRELRQSHRGLPKEVQERMLGRADHDEMSEEIRSLREKGIYDDDPVSRLQHEIKELRTRNQEQMIKANDNLDRLKHVHQEIADSLANKQSIAQEEIARLLEEIETLKLKNEELEDIVQVSVEEITMAHKLLRGGRSQEAPGQNFRGHAKTEVNNPYLIDLQ